MEDVFNESKIKLASTNLGLDHLTTPYFQQVKDGFGLTLESGRDFLEMMVTHKNCYTLSTFSYFSPPTQDPKR